jgi:hypothetical protein
MVHTDTCCSYHCIKPFLCDTVGHRNRLDMLIPLHITFLCRASAISVNLVSILSCVTLNRNSNVLVYILVLVAHNWYKCCHESN